MATRARVHRSRKTIFTGRRFVSAHDFRACGKMAFVRKDLYQGTTSVVPSGLQSALGALKTNHFLSPASRLRRPQSRGYQRPASRLRVASLQADVSVAKKARSSCLRSALKQM